MIGEQLLNLMYGDPANQLSRTLNPGGPNPNPGASQNPPPGGAPGAAPSAPAGGGPPMAPANATQSPPDLASLYVDLTRRDQAAHQIDQGTALMASAFGTAQQQHDMMDYAKSIPQDNSAGMIGGILTDQKAQQAQQEHNRFMAGSSMMAKLLGTDEPTAQWLMNNQPALNEVLQTHIAASAPTEAIKNTNAATDAWATAHPNASKEEVEQYRSDLLSGVASGGDMTTKEMNAANRAWDSDSNNKNQPKPTWLTNPSEYKGHVAQLVEDQKDIGNAKNAFGTNIAKLTPVNETIQWLKDHPEAVAEAIHHPNLTGGNIGYYTGGKLAGGSEALTARQKLDFLNDQIYSTSFTGGGAANQRLAAVEAQRLGAAFNPFKGENAANLSDQDIKNYLQTLKDSSDSAIANTKAAAGHQLTPEEAKARYLNPDYFDPYSTLHSGATVAKGEDKPAGGSGSPTYTYNKKTGQLE